MIFSSVVQYGTGELLLIYRSLSFNTYLNVTTAEFSKFAGILSEAISQHHLSGFEIAQLGFHHLPLALFIVMLPKAHLTSHSRMSASRRVITPPCYLGHEDLFCTVLLCILATSSSASVRSIPFWSFIGTIFA